MGAKIQPSRRAGWASGLFGLLPMLMHGVVKAATVPKLKFSDERISRDAPPPASFAPVKE